MKVFQIVQKLFRMLGIDLKQSIRKHPFNLRNFIALLVYGGGTISSTIYTLFLAKTFGEYIESCYVLSTILMLFTVYVFVIWRMPKLTKFFALIETMTTKRTCF